MAQISSGDTLRIQVDSQNGFTQNPTFARSSTNTSRNFSFAPLINYSRFLGCEQIGMFAVRRFRLACVDTEYILWHRDRQRGREMFDGSGGCEDTTFNRSLATRLSFDDQLDSRFSKRRQASVERDEPTKPLGEWAIKRQFKIQTILIYAFS